MRSMLIILIHFYLVSCAAQEEEGVKLKGIWKEVIETNSNLVVELDEYGNRIETTIYGKYLFFTKHNVYSINGNRGFKFDFEFTTNELIIYKDKYKVLKLNDSILEIKNNFEHKVYTKYIGSSMSIYEVVKLIEKEPLLYLK